MPSSEGMPAENSLQASTGSMNIDAGRRDRVMEIPSQNRMMMQPGPMDIGGQANYGRFTNPGGMRGRYNQSPYQARHGGMSRGRQQFSPYGDLFNTVR